MLSCYITSGRLSGEAWTENSWDAQRLSEPSCLTTPVCIFCGCRCEEELKAFFGTAKEEEDIVSGNTEASERQRLCAGVRQGERMALEVGVLFF